MIVQFWLHPGNYSERSLFCEFSIVRFAKRHLWSWPMHIVCKKHTYWIHKITLKPANEVFHCLIELVRFAIYCL